MKLIVGLGNPGRRYAYNRHNIGFICLNYFARSHGIKFDKKQGQARVGLGEIGGEPVVLAKPQTYMNSSGVAVGLLADRYRVGPEELTVVHDDLDLPLGRIRIRQGGTSGGHKGIESVIASLGTQDFIRLRIGIGRPLAAAGEEDIIAFVLSDFSSEEKQAITSLIPKVSEALLTLLRQGPEVAMNEYNGG